jgi:hypothetical protein
MVGKRDAPTTIPYLEAKSGSSTPLRRSPTSRERSGALLVPWVEEPVTTASVTLPSLDADLPRYNSNLGRRLSGAYPPCSDRRKPQRGRAGASY